VSEYHENPVLDRRGRERIAAWHSRVLRDSEGRFQRVLSAGEDVTERARMLDALTGSENRFRGTSENAAVGIAAVGLDGGWLQVTQRLCEIIALTGHGHEEAIARSLAAGFDEHLVKPVDGQMLRAVLAKVG
jgi:PAS domain-containing protein